MLSFVATALLGCRVELGPPAAPATAAVTDQPAGELWIYTSMYQGTVDAFTKLIADDLPDVTVKWFTSGSEKVAQRYETERAAGSSPACLLMTSDPFWYAGLAARGDLAPHFAPNVLRIDRGWVDPDGLWVASRVSLMVLAHHPERAPDPPSRFADLPGAAAIASMPDPLASGTAFTFLSFVTHDGWHTVDGARAAGLVAAGGNSAVLQRIETGERPVGVVLLENVLTAQRKGAPVAAVFPTDGAVSVPGPIAITAACANPTAARAVYDLVLSPAGQELMRQGDMFSVLPGFAPPEGAPPFDTIAVRPWTAQLVSETTTHQAAIKKRWAEGP